MLDWLAVEFMESGWDVKHLMRTIVTSETYRRSSTITSTEQYELDPENRLLARGPRFRLPSWMIRDQALASSGILNDRQGGASVNGYQPEGVWEEASFGRKRYSQAKAARCNAGVSTRFGAGSSGRRCFSTRPSGRCAR